MNTPGTFTRQLAERIASTLADDPAGVIGAAELQPLVEKAQAEVDSLAAALDRIPASWVQYVQDGDGGEDTPDDRLIKLLSWAARRLPHSVREHLAEVDNRIDISI